MFACLNIEPRRIVRIYCSGRPKVGVGPIRIHLVLNNLGSVVIYCVDLPLRLFRNRLMQRLNMIGVPFRWRTSRKLRLIEGWSIVLNLNRMSCLKRMRIQGHDRWYRPEWYLFWVQERALSQKTLRIRHILHLISRNDKLRARVKVWTVTQGR